MEKFNFGDKEVSAFCIINTLASELRGKRKKKVMHQPFLAPETQTVKRNALLAQHAAIFLLHFYGISAFNWLSPEL